MTNPPVKVLTVGNKTLNIYNDLHPESPREWDNMARMIFFGKQKGWGDDHEMRFDINFESRADFIERGAASVKKHFNALVVVPVHVYTHSGSSISTSYAYPFNDQWDSGTCGFAILTRETILKNYEKKRMSKALLEAATYVLENEVKTLNQYIQGDVYGYVLNDENGEEIDSCWGFYGNDFATNGLAHNLPNEFLEALNK